MSGNSEKMFKTRYTLSKWQCFCKKIEHFHREKTDMPNFILLTIAVGYHPYSCHFTPKSILAKNFKIHLILCFKNINILYSELSLYLFH